MRVRLAFSAAMVVLLPLAARAEAPGSSSPRASGAGEAVGAAAPPPTVEHLGQDEVVRRALLRSGALRSARARRAGAEAQTRSARGRLLPSVNVSDEAQRWDSTYGAQFPAGPGVTVPVTIREQTTNSFSATAGQPLLGLLHIGADVAALGSAERAAEADVRASEAAVKEATLSQLLQLFEARALGVVAQASVDQLSEQLEKARARLAAGVLTRADVLRIETAVAAAQQQVIQAGAQEESARAALLVAIGEPPDAQAVDFDEPLLPEPTTAPDLAPALATALSRRPELASARDAEQAARRNALARTFDLLPEVSAEAAYLHVTGQAFSPEDSGFVGLTMSWPVWEWGARWYTRSAAVARAESAAAQEVDARDGVSAQVAARLATTRASAHAIEVARTAIASAEEAYRVTKALVQAGSATTTDLLDAQAALTSAHSNLARARYGYALARVHLARTLGEL